MTLGEVNQIRYYSDLDDRNTITYDEIMYQNDEDGIKNNLFQYSPINNIEINTLPGTKLKFTYRILNDSNKTNKYVDIIIDHTGNYYLDCTNLIEPIGISIEKESLDLIKQNDFAFFIMTMY